MGCGSSKGVPASTPRPGASPKAEKSEELQTQAIQSVRPHGDGIEQKSRLRSVAFEVPIQPKSQVEDSEIDRILRRPLPPRLKRLEPLENAPTLTADQLQEKLRKAEEKRKRMLDKRRASGISISKRHRDLMRAKEMEQQQQVLNDEHIRNKINSADRNRELRLQEVQEKQRLRELKAIKTREKAKKIKEIDELVDYEIERYDITGENGNDSDTDSWLNEGNNRKKSTNIDSRMSSGQEKRMSSGYSSRDASASTQCSTQGPTRMSSGRTEVTLLEVGGGVVTDADDFFDS